jgi:hypothetical protein
LHVGKTSLKKLRHRSLVRRDITAALHLGKDTGAFLLRLVPLQPGRERH